MKDRKRLMVIAATLAVSGVTVAVVASGGESGAGPDPVKAASLSCGEEEPFGVAQNLIDDRGQGAATPLDAVRTYSERTFTSVDLSDLTARPISTDLRLFTDSADERVQASFTVERFESGWYVTRHEACASWLSEHDPGPITPDDIGV